MAENNDKPKKKFQLVDIDLSKVRKKAEPLKIEDLTPAQRKGLKQSLDVALTYKGAMDFVESLNPPPPKPDDAINIGDGTEASTKRDLRRFLDDTAYVPEIENTNDSYTNPGQLLNDNESRINDIFKNANIPPSKETREVTGPSVIQKEQKYRNLKKLLDEGSVELPLYMRAAKLIDEPLGLFEDDLRRFSGAQDSNPIVKPFAESYDRLVSAPAELFNKITGGKERFATPEYDYEKNITNDIVSTATHLGIGLAEIMTTGKILNSAIKGGGLVKNFVKGGLSFTLPGTTATIRDVVNDKKSIDDAATETFTSFVQGGLFSFNPFKKFDEGKLPEVSKLDIPEKELSKLTKLYNMSRMGESGEKDVAEKMLQKGLKKNNLTIDDLQFAVENKVPLYINPENNVIKEMLYAATVPQLAPLVFNKDYNGNEFLTDVGITMLMEAITRGMSTIGRSKEDLKKAKEYSEKEPSKPDNQVNGNRKNSNLSSHEMEVVKPFVDEGIQKGQAPEEIIKNIETQHEIVIPEASKEELKSHIENTQVETPPSYSLSPNSPTDEMKMNERYDSWYNLNSAHEEYVDSIIAKIKPIEKEIEGLTGKENAAKKKDLMLEVARLDELITNAARKFQSVYFEQSEKENEMFLAEAEKRGLQFKNDTEKENFLYDIGTELSSDRPYSEYNFNKTVKEVFDTVVDEYKNKPEEVPPPPAQDLTDERWKDVPFDSKEPEKPATTEKPIEKPSELPPIDETKRIKSDKPRKEPRQRVKISQQDLEKAGNEKLTPDEVKKVVDENKKAKKNRQLSDEEVEYLKDLNWQRWQNFNQLKTHQDYKGSSTDWFKSDEFAKVRPFYDAVRAKYERTLKTIGKKGLENATKDEMKFVLDTVNFDDEIHKGEIDKIISKLPEYEVKQVETGIYKGNYFGVVKSGEYEGLESTRTPDKKEVERKLAQSIYSKNLKGSTSSEEKKSSTQVNIPKEYHKPILDFVNSVKDNDLYTEDGTDKYGKETEPHVTVLYGLKTNKADDIKNVVKEFGDVKISFGKTSLFENEKYDVLKVDVKSEDLNKLNKLIGNKLDYSNDYDSYHPHLTIAYLKKGEGKKYAGKTIKGLKDISLDKMIFSDKERNHTELSLKGEKKIEPKEEIKSEEKIESDVDKKLSDIKVFDKPISELSTDVQRFQGRKTDYSEESVQNIIEKYDAQKFQPIRYWHDPVNKKDYVLSGHSRLEAMRRTNAKTIPAIEFKGSEAEAIEFGINSNSRHTSEKSTERANYYRNLREKGTPEADILKDAKRFEKKNAQTVYNYSFLKKGGPVEEALNVTDGGDKQLSASVEIMATWIGGLRKDFPELTDNHEREIFDYLKKNFGKNYARTKTEFKGRIENIVTNEFFNPLAPLNLNNKIISTGVERNYQEEISKAKKELNTSKEKRDKALKELVDKKVSAQQIEKLMKKYNDEVLYSEQELSKLEGAYDKVMEARGKEISMFDNADEVESTEAAAPEKKYSEKYPIVKPKEYISDLQKKGYEYLEKNIDKMIADYKVKMDNVVNTDDVRELFIPAGYNFMNANDYHEPASDLSKIIFEIFKDEKKIGVKNPTCYIIVGGPGSGKSFSTKSVLKDKVKNATIVYDGVLSKWEGLEKRVASAIKDGYEVHLAYVYSPPEKAWKNVLERMQTAKRPVPLDYFIETYKDFNYTIPHVASDFDGTIDYDLIDNSGSKDEVKNIGIENIIGLDYNPNVDNLLKLTKEYHDNKRITDEQLRGILRNQELQRKFEGIEESFQGNDGSDNRGLEGKQNGRTEGELTDGNESSDGSKESASDSNSGGLERNGSDSLEEAPTDNLPETGTRGKPRKQSTGSSRNNTSGSSKNKGTSSDGESNDRGSDGAELGVGNTSGGTDPTGTRGKQLTGDGKNYIIKNDSEIVSDTTFSKTKKADDNLEALKLLNLLDKENRYATEQEQKILVKYAGWGGIPDIFDENKSDWENRRTTLRSLINPQEFKDARASTLSAFYTPPPVIRGIYSILEKAGFKSGRILDPSMGTGHFFGLLPGMMRKSKLYGVELDSISGRIAKKLYPNASVDIKGFEDVRKYGEDYFDTVVTNVPFGDFPVMDKRYDKKLTSKIHNYFFVKALDVVKPGGIVVFVTSKGTMDARDSAIRKYIGKKVDFIGAIRLPNSVFSKIANTKVTTDIIVLRKKIDGETRENPAFEKVAPYLDRNGEEMKINQYFKDNPEMMIGDMEMGKGLYSDKEPVLVYRGEDFAIDLGKAISNLPNDYYVEAKAVKKDIQTYESEESLQDASVPDGAFINKEGTIYRKINGAILKQEITDAKKRDKMIKQMKMNETARKVLQKQLSSDDDSLYKKDLEELNKEYDAYVKQYGFLNEKANVNILKDKDYGDDPNRAFVLSLENYNEETKKAVKSDRFSKRTAYPVKTIEKVDNVKDALVVSFNTTGKLDVDTMVKLVGKPYNEVIEDLKSEGLIYLDKDNWESADEYLTGNVRKKLHIAKKQLEETGNEEYKRNIEALEKVQPEDLKYTDLSLGLGATWIPKSDYEQFIADVFEVDKNSIKVQYVGGAGKFYVTFTDWAALNNNVHITNDFGIPEYKGIDIFEAGLNNQVPKIWYKDKDDKAVLDIKKSAAAQDRLQKLKDRFKTWLWEDEGRKKRLTDIYNRDYNNIRIRTYDGAHLSLPDADPNISQKLFPHVKDAIWRIIQQRNLLLAHGVGFGKTWTMCASAMELRRLGLAKKPMHVVKNHMIGQYANEFQQLYPNAKLLVISPDEFTPAKRKVFMSRIANGDWDSVIVAFTVFEKFPLFMETQTKFINEQIDVLESHLNQLKDEGSSSNRSSIKDIEKSLRKLKEKLKDKLDEGEKDDSIKFEETGVDQIFVDEAHNFKNLFFPTKLTNMAGLSRSESGRAMDLYAKIRHIFDRYGKGVVLATGTPVSNSMSELFTMMRYLQPDLLKEYGIEHFDSWINNFGDIASKYELNILGTGIKLKTRLASFKNIPEIMNIFRQNADVKTKKDVKLNVPATKGGKPETVIADGGNELKLYVQSLAERYQAYIEKKVTPDVDNPLVITNDGRKAALDLRLVGINVDLPDSKINQVVRKTAEIYKNSMKTKSAQMIFSDLGTPTGKGFNVYKDIKDKLVKSGLPEKEVVFIHDFKTKESRTKLFKEVREGKIRVLIGSTSKMGEGTNAQKKLLALHHVDSPWRPSDLEQRDGRILRSGNENSEVEIYRYITEGSFDAYMWQLLENKTRFIEQVFTNDTSIRNAEDVEGRALSFAEVKALATGNPLILEKFKVEDELHRVQMLRNEFLNDKDKMKGEISSIPNEIKSKNEYIKKLSSAYSPAPEKLKITIDGTVFDKRVDAGERLIKTISSVDDLVYRKKVGEYLGFDILYTLEKLSLFADKKSVIEKIHLSKNGVVVEIDVSDSPSGLITKIENAVERIKTEISSNEKAITNIEKRLSELQKRLDSKFDKEDRYQELTTKQREIEKALDVDKDDSLAGQDTDGEITIESENTEAEVSENEGVEGYENKVDSAGNDISGDVVEAKLEPKGKTLPSKFFQALFGRYDVTVDGIAAESGLSKKEVSEQLKTLYQSGKLEKRTNGYGITEDFRAVLADMRSNPSKYESSYDKLYSNPIGEVLKGMSRATNFLDDVWEKVVGEKVWNFILKGSDTASRKILGEKLVEKIKTEIITNYGLPDPYIEKKRETLAEVERYKQMAKDIADLLYYKDADNKTEPFKRHEQIRIGQIIKGGITTNPIYKERAEQVREILKELHDKGKEVGVLPIEVYSDKLPRKRIHELLTKKAKAQAKLNEILTKDRYMLASSEDITKLNKLKSYITYADNKIKTSYKLGGTGYFKRVYATKEQGNEVLELMKKYGYLAEDGTDGALINRSDITLEVEQDAQMDIGKMNNRLEDIKAEKEKLNKRLDRLSRSKLPAEKVQEKIDKAMTRMEELDQRMLSMEANAKTDLVTKSLTYKDARKLMLRRSSNVSITKFFDAISNNPIFTVGTPEPGYVRMPDAPQYGPLAGKYVERSIADDIKGDFRTNLENLSPLKAKLPTRLDLTSAIYRQDIPVEVRIAMGEVLTASYPTAKAIMLEGLDVSLGNLFKFVSEHAEYVSDVERIGYVQMPDNDMRLGKLQGKWIHPVISGDVKDLLTYTDEHYIDSFIKKGVAMWKVTKTSMNPATHIRNILSARIMLDYAGVDWFTQFRLAAPAMELLMEKGKYAAEFKASGLLNTSFSKNELDKYLDVINPGDYKTGMKNKWNDFMGLDTGDKIIKAYGLATLTDTKLGETLSNLYQAEDMYSKAMAFIYGREKGMSIIEARDFANKWIFDYSEVPRLVEKLRSGSFLLGMPFISYTAKAIPRVMEASIKRPFTFWKYIGIIAAATGIALKNLNMSEDEWQDLKTHLPDRLRKGQWILLPWRDDSGKLQYLDLTYIMPYKDLWDVIQSGWTLASQGMLNSSDDVLEGITGLISNPVFTAIAEISTNKSRYLNRPIWNDTDSPGEKAAKQFDYLYKLMMPSLHPEIPGLTKGGYGYDKLANALFDRPDYQGRVYSVLPAVSSAIFGIKVNPLDVVGNLDQESGKYKAEILELSKKKSGILKNDGISKEERLKKANEIDLQIETLKKKVESIEDKTIPVSFEGKVLDRMIKRLERKTAEVPDAKKKEHQDKINELKIDLDKLKQEKYGSKEDLSAIKKKVLKEFDFEKELKNTKAAITRNINDDDEKGAIEDIEYLRMIAKNTGVKKEVREQIQEFFSENFKEYLEAKMEKISDDLEEGKITKELANKRRQVIRGIYKKYKIKN